MRWERPGIVMPLAEGMARRSGWLVVASVSLIDGPLCRWHRLLRRAEIFLGMLREHDQDAIVVPLPIAVDGSTSASTGDRDVADGTIIWCPARRRIASGRVSDS